MFHGKANQSRFSLANDVRYLLAGGLRFGLIERAKKVAENPASVTAATSGAHRVERTATAKTDIHLFFNQLRVVLSRCRLPQAFLLFGHSL